MTCAESGAGRARPFALRVPDDVLDDLRARLAHTRWPDEAPGYAAWQLGTELSYVRELVEYWRTTFDWREQEARLNAFPQYVARGADIDLHFLHVPGKGPKPLPMLLSHGWPGSVWEFHKLIPLLRQPDDPNDAFTVVAPSLPGYTLSFKPGQRRFSVPAIGDAFRELMNDVLGYDRFAAQGGDWGASICAYLGLAHPQAVLGIHLNLMPIRRDRPGTEDDAEMRAYVQELDYWLTEETGYSSIQGTKPQTLAYALTDSPVGLAAWIVEKFNTWSDHGGNLETCFSKDDLLTNIMLYWVSGAIGSAFWPYYARQHEGWPLPADAHVKVPTAYQSFPKHILHPPRRLAERVFNIQRWTVEQRGGHFAALEQPQALAEDVRAFFRQFR